MYIYIYTLRRESPLRRVRGSVNDIEQDKILARNWGWKRKFGELTKTGLGFIEEHFQRDQQE